MRILKLYGVPNRCVFKLCYIHYVVVIICVVWLLFDNKNKRKTQKITKTKKSVSMFTDGK